MRDKLSQCTRPVAALVFISLFILQCTSCALCCRPEPGANGQNFPVITGDGTLTFPSRMNGEVQVTDHRGHRLLNFKSGGRITHESRMDLQNPALLLFEYTRCFLMGFALFPEPRAQVQDVLMIGLGAGSLLRFTRKYFPTTRIDVVEIDPLVVDLAKRYFFVTESESVKIHVADGRAHVDKTGRSHDLVIIDAFNSDDTVPRQLASVEFLRSLKSRLAPRGVVVTNFVRRDGDLYKSALATYLRLFKCVMRFELDPFGAGNAVIVATDDPGKDIGRTEMARRAARLKTMLSERYDLQKYAGVCERLYPRQYPVPVIHDL